MTQELLKFSKENAKLENIKDYISEHSFEYLTLKKQKFPNIASFSLPSGYSCPFADECLSKADRNTGKVTDGKNTKFRCFSTSTESVFPTVRNQKRK